MRGGVEGFFAGYGRLSLKIWGVRLKTLILRHEAKRENPR